MTEAKTVCIAFAVGCPRNQTDTAWLTSYFQANGWTLVQRAQHADLIVVSTCGFAAEVEEQSIRLISLLHKKRRKTSKLIVVGCLAGINPGRVVQGFGATAIPPADLHELDHLIGATVPLQDVSPVNCIEPRILAAKMCWSISEAHPSLGTVATMKYRTKRAVYSFLSHVGTDRFAMRTARRLSRRAQGEPADPTFYIRVARGCLEECTYCAIRQATGTLRSKPLDKVLSEFDLGLTQKYTSFEILAEDIGSYGLDIGSSCVELFEKLLTRKGPYKLVLTDVNVRYLIRYTPALSDLLAADADRIRWLKVPVQSGSDRILRLMKRCYTHAEAKASLTYLREKAPALPLDTHVLVGFPGETDQDFEATVDLLRAIRFDRVQVYSYTDRPNTSACNLPDKVDEEVKQQRVQRLASEFPMAGVPARDSEERDSDKGPTCSDTSCPTA